MSKSCRIAVAQTEISSVVSDNLAKARSFTRDAAATGADMIVFPEMFMAHPRPGAALAELAEPLDGPFVSSLAELARTHGIAIACGLWETVPGEAARAANVLIVLDASGKLVARYNKIHLFDALSVKESEKMTGGNVPPPVITLNGIKLGLAICYDLRFPELFRDLARRGADGVIIPAAWYSGPLKEDHWLTLLRARAVENTFYTIGSNLCGSTFAARSAIFDPFGVPLADGGEGEGLISAVLEEKRIAAVRSKLPSLEHARPELFRG